jgi:hypothetical protein
MILGRAGLQSCHYDPHEARALAPEGPADTTEKTSPPKLKSHQPENMWGGHSCPPPLPLITIAAAQQACHRDSPMTAIEDTIYCHSVATPSEKGNALENAVGVIEHCILQTSPSLKEKTFLIENKKIIVVGSVHHEIDIFVTIDPGPGYKSFFIFECKNWQDAVGKNDIVIFSEKIDVSQAQHGYFVARSFTKDARAQAAKDPRMTLLLASEHDPSTAPCLSAFIHAIDSEKSQTHVLQEGTHPLGTHPAPYQRSRQTQRHHHRHAPIRPKMGRTGLRRQPSILPHGETARGYIRTVCGFQARIPSRRTAAR